MDILKITHPQPALNDFSKSPLTRFVDSIKYQRIKRFTVSTTWLIGLYIIVIKMQEKNIKKSSISSELIKSNIKSAKKWGKISDVKLKKYPDFKIIYKNVLNHS